MVPVDTVVTVEVVASMEATVEGHGVMAIGVATVEMIAGNQDGVRAVTTIIANQSLMILGRTRKVPISHVCRLTLSSTSRKEWRFGSFNSRI